MQSLLGFSVPLLAVHLWGVALRVSGVEHIGVFFKLNVVLGDE